VRGVERIGPYNHALKVVPSAECNVADIGDVPMRSRFSLPDCIEDIAAYYARIHAAGVKPLSVGGDHSVTYPILKALGRQRPVGLVHFDAHCDTGGEYDGSKFNHGGPFRLAVLDGVVDPARTIQIGIRGPAEFLWEFSYESGMTVLHIEDVARLGIDGVIAKAREIVGDGPTYISFDVDGLDPAFAPGTGTPETGGLTPREAQAILHGLKGLDVIGGDVVEVAPQYDPTTNTAMVGAQMLFEIFSLMVLGKRFRRRG
jgi:agmatinase